MRPKIKICGITNLDDALFCANAGADALGFIFYRSSPRYTQPSSVARIIEQLPLSVTPVGVFVNERRESIEQIVSETGIRLIQMSGDESPDDCRGFEVKVWKAFRFTNVGEVEKLRSYEVEAAMLDGSRNGLYGGSGVLADLEVARAMKRFHPLIIAGGLNADNIENTIKIVEPFGIDINSGVELFPGKKDHEKVKKLFENLRSIPSLISFPFTDSTPPRPSPSLLVEKGREQREGMSP